jgi:hypothetical protein
MLKIDFILQKFSSSNSNKKHTKRVVCQKMLIIILYKKEAF